MLHKTKAAKSKIIMNSSANYMISGLQILRATDTIFFIAISPSSNFHNMNSYRFKPASDPLIIIKNKKSIGYITFQKYKGTKEKDSIRS